MCGRFSFVASKEKIETQFGDIEVGNNLRHNFNISPTQHAYVITNDSPNRLQYITWGLIPYWSRDGENKGKLINARMEGIYTKPSFRLPIRKRRCLILADSFYEWKMSGGIKVPYRILLRSGDLMAFAGIWDIWMKGDYAVKSFSIITTSSNLEMGQISYRMPAILGSRTAQEDWLKNKELAEVLNLLKPLPDNSLKIHRVSEKVNSIKNNSAELHQAIPDPLTLFK